MELLFSPPTYSFKDDDNNKDVVAVVTHPLSEFSQGGEKTAPILIRVLDSAPGGVLMTRLMKIKVEHKKIFGKHQSLPDPKGAVYV